MLQTLSPDKLGTKREKLSQLLLFFVFLLRISDGKSIVTVYKPGLLVYDNVDNTNITT